MRWSCGGGLATSLVVRETLSQDVSRVFSSFLEALQKIFPPSSGIKPEEKIQKNQSLNIAEAFKKIYDFSAQTLKSFCYSLIDLVCSFWKLKNKNWKNIIPENDSQDNEVRQEGQQQKVSWKDLFNGLWIMCHFKYRDVFEVEFGSVFYLLWGTIIDMGKWEWKLDKILESLKNIEHRLQQSIKETLKFLVSLKLLGENRSKKSQQNSQYTTQNKIKITRNNMKWATYVWIAPQDSQQ